jgi:4-hydroxy-tetrahydrodipicolinate reductase
MAIQIGIAASPGGWVALLAEEVAAAGAVLAGGTVRPGSGKAGPRRRAGAADAAALFAASDVSSTSPMPRSRASRRPRGADGQGPRARLLRPECRAGTRRGGGGGEGAGGLRRQFCAGRHLVLALAERMAAALPPAAYDAEIVEMHHRQKVDAPSGTAIAMGRAVAAGRGTTLEAAGIDSGRDGHTGPRATGTIGFAALRGGQVVGEHTLLFASATEHIALTHRSFDRRAYATGAVRAALWLQGRPAGLYGMREVLGM